MAYDPDGTVVGNATALSDDIDNALAVSQAMTASLIILRQKVLAFISKPRPSLSLSGPVSKPESNSGTTEFVFTLTLDRDGSTDEIPYSFAVVGTGENPADPADFGGTYPSGSGSFGGSETVKTITILAMGDTAKEQTEAFTLVVSSPGLADVSAVGTIVDDDVIVPIPAFVLTGPVSIVEGTPAAVLPAFALTGPSSIIEGTPEAVVPAFAFTGPNSIAEGNASSAFALTGPATIAEGN